MTVFACLASKGGVGKSTLSRSLAVQGLIDGKRSAIIDADPQGTCTLWSKRRSQPAPTVIPLGSKSIAELVAELQGRGAEIIVIDAPPHSQPIINLAAQACDLALIVTGPYPDDLEQVGAVARITQSMQKASAIVFNRTPSKASALTLARSALSAFTIPICPTALTQLVAHPYASAEGLTAQEREPSSRAAKEIEHVWEWIKELKHG